MGYFIEDYARAFGEMLHVHLSSTKCYKHEIIEVVDTVTGLLITYDNQREDTFEVAW